MQKVAFCRVKDGLLQGCLPLFAWRQGRGWRVDGGVRTAAGF